MIASAVAQGIDAVLLPIGDLEQEHEALSQLSQAAGDIPWGGLAKIVSREDMGQLVKLGCDFVVFTTNEVSASILAEDRLGKVLKIDNSLSDSLLRTIAYLPIDAVLLGAEDESPLTLRQMMDYRRVVGLVGKPSLSVLSSGLSAADIRGLWDVGIQGVVLLLEQQRLSQVRESIQSLPSTRRVRKGTGVTLPFIGEGSGEEEEEEP
jgi:hypothetical protein